MKKISLVLFLVSIFNCIYADLAIPKYRKEKKSLKISGVKKYPDYKWYAKVNYQNNNDDEFEIIEDPQVLDYMHYKENNIEVSIWAINKKTKTKTKPVEFKMPYQKGYTLIIKGVKKNKIKNKQKEIAVIAFKINSPNDINSTSLLPLVFVSLVSLCCFFFVKKQFSVKLN